MPFHMVATVAMLLDELKIVHVSMDLSQTHKKRNRQLAKVTALRLGRLYAME